MAFAARQALINKLSSHNGCHSMDRFLSGASIYAILPWVGKNSQGFWLIFAHMLNLDSDRSEKK
jgi:hypothetical protein